MDRNVILTLIFFVFGIPCSSLLRLFHYVNLKMNWTNAQHYCRGTYTDLATIKSMEHISMLNRPTLDTSVAWIGLNDDPQGWKGVMGNDANSWRWSTTGPSRTGYQNWDYGEPNDKYIEYCGSMDIYGLWNDASCATLFSFVCYTETAQNTKTFVFIASQLTWSDAQSYCRQYFIDLPTIENSVDNTKVYNVIPSNINAWIGLYRLAWKWSDYSNSPFRNWQTGQPDNYNTNQYCVSENKLHQWEDDTCSNTYAFICHEDVFEQNTVVKMKIESGADMRDPAANTQLLQKLGAVLRTQGLPYVTLQWTIQPRKQEKVKDDEYLCTTQF